MNKNCTLSRTMDVLGKRWTLLILIELHKGTSTRKRFNQLRSRLPDITPKMLSARLKELEVEHIIKKTVDNSSVPIRCEYELTARGKEFIRIIKSIKSWALRWNIKNKLCESTDCKKCIL